MVVQRRKSPFRIMKKEASSNEYTTAKSLSSLSKIILVPERKDLFELASIFYTFEQGARPITVLHLPLSSRAFPKHPPPLPSTNYRQADPPAVTQGLHPPFPSQALKLPQADPPQGLHPPFPSQTLKLPARRTTPA